MTIIMTLTLALLLSAAVTLLIQNYAEEQVRKAGRIVVDMATVGLLHSMHEGMESSSDPEQVRNNIKVLFEELANIPGLIEMRALRGESVDRQYGMVESRGEIEPVEKIMLETGKITEEISLNANGIKVFHYNGPLIARTTEEGLNCMSCHDASEGEVLGGLSVQMDMSAEQNAVYSAIYQLLGLLLLVSISFTFAVRRTFMPMVDVVGQITSAFGKARKGDFSERILHTSNDEVGEISHHTNHLMESLDNHVGAIARDIEGLTGKSFINDDIEPMQHVANVVHNLTSAVRFKEEIEADRNLDEVYQHFQRILVNQFGIDKFAIYEMSSKKHESVPVLISGLPDGFTNWCSEEVLGDSEVCRAKRSVRAVDSRKDQGICPPFCSTRKETCENMRHICLPELNSEGDGVVLQIIFYQEEEKEIEGKVSLLEYYLRVAAPEIEAKRLMRSLKETTLRDPLTGLYNRRFLEDFKSSLEASVKRRGESVAVLMCDIDLFKQVNDKRGHASGDKVLIKTASILREAVRANDLIVRYGGEEIVVILVNADEDRSLEVAERIRSNIESYVMQDEKGTFGITISIGLAMYPENGEHLSGCMALADSALYKAKESGRNQVVRYQNGE